MVWWGASDQADPSIERLLLRQLDTWVCKVVDRVRGAILIVRGNKVADLALAEINENGIFTIDCKCIARFIAYSVSSKPAFNDSASSLLLDLKNFFCSR